MGNLCQTPELKETQQGIKYCNFSIATNYKNKDGVNLAEFHNIVAWTKQAELICEYLDKGRKILLEGSLKTDCYEKDGVKKYSTKIILRNFEFVDSKPKEEKPKDVQQAVDNVSQTFGGRNFQQDEIPF